MSQTSEIIALVTGVGRTQGIGFEVCRQLAEQGLTVILTARNLEEAEANAKQLAEQGLPVLPKPLDVSKDESVRQLATEIEAFGKLDVLINNAAINFDFQQPTIGVDLNVVHEALETNFFGAWRTCNAFTVKFATALKDTGILVNAVCPGYTATYPEAEAMGARPVEEGAASVVWAATLPDDGPTGGFFRDGKPLPW